MKTKSDYILREIAGTQVVLPTGKASIDFYGVITLNKTGAFLYSLLANEKTEQDLIAALLDKFDVDEKAANKDLNEFINELREAKLLE